MLRHRHQPSTGGIRTAASVAAVAVLFTAVSAVAQTSGVNFPAAPGKKGDYQPLRPVAARFEIEFPKKNWRVAPGYAAALVIFEQNKNEANVGVEHLALRLPLALDVIGDEVARREIEDLRVARPGAQGFASAFRVATDGRIIVTDFTQATAIGAVRGRQYSLPRGLDLYRVVCTATETAFPRYEAIFEYMAASLKIVTPTAAP